MHGEDDMADDIETKGDQQADTVAKDDANKVEKLTKAGRKDFDPDAGSD